MIRAATGADIASLAEMVDAVHQLHLAATPERYQDLPVAEIEIALGHLLADPAITILVAADGAGELVGYVVVRRVEPSTNVFATPRILAHVDQLGVRDRARRGGHGRALMRAAEALAATWGAAAVMLDVQAFNDGALRFYESIGYAVTGRRMARRVDE